MYPWYMWNNNLRQLTVGFTALVSFFIGFAESGRFCVTQKHLVFAFFLLVSLLWNYTGGDGGLILFAEFFIWTYLATLVSLDKMYMLQFITKWTACLILVSLIFYLLFFSGILSINPTFISLSDGRYQSWNYYVFTVYAQYEVVYRFMGFFMEPGHMTMGVVPLIMANGFDLKNKYVKILLLCEFFTLSLAGYVTLFIGYLLFHGSIRSLNTLLGGAVFIVILIYLIDFFGFSDILQVTIWDRLEIKNGEIAGNNRVSAEFDKVYQYFICSSKVWTGNELIDLTAYGGIAGYKKYLVQNGIIGLLFTLLVYGYNYLMCFKYKVAIFTLILLMLLFQNAYPYWFCVMSTYILGCDNLRKQTIFK